MMDYDQGLEATIKGLKNNETIEVFEHKFVNNMLVLTTKTPPCIETLYYLKMDGFELISVLGNIVWTPGKEKPTSRNSKHCFVSYFKKVVV